MAIGEEEDEDEERTNNGERGRAKNGTMACSSKRVTRGGWRTGEAEWNGVNGVYSVTLSS